MIGHLTLRVDAAQSDARINALLFGAGSVLRALGADHTFGLAVRRRALVPPLTRADGSAAHTAANTVQAARRGAARVGWGRRLSFCTKMR